MLHVLRVVALLVAIEAGLPGKAGRHRFLGACALPGAEADALL